MYLLSYVHHLGNHCKLVIDTSLNKFKYDI